jgi:hypothetical protein
MADAVLMPPEKNGANIDLNRITIGKDTFRNPFFWIVIGVTATLAFQYFVAKRRRMGD